ncbi:uncharacterized mitochondrial protein AtMg00810-like [Quercus suber]|uniref:uncharacterized mitochondrial protein AtMg00810-like n=1 Tax=Quercus suber TaxID=58331 RepID=UPI0032DFABF5
MRLRSKTLNVITHSCYLSQFELKKVDEALQNADWINSMLEELHQFVWNDVWELVPRPKGVNVIGTKWIFKNKSNEHAQIYVDDIVFGATNESGATNDSLAKSFADEMKKMFEMSMVGELTYLLGLQVKQTDSRIYINQAKYARNLVKRFGLEKSAHARTPMVANAKLTNDPSGESVKVTLYRSTIGCLLYLIASHPDIAFSVGVCSKFQSNPKVSHLNAIKRIIKYISGTCDYGLFYSKKSNMSLAGYSDAYWVGNANDRKNTTGGCFYVGANLVAWISKSQNYVSLSTTEVEYIAAGSCCSQLLWMKKLLGDYEISQDTMVVYCDNSSAINVSKNPVQHSKTKHIEIRYHFIRDLVERKIVVIEYIPTES